MDEELVPYNVNDDIDTDALVDLTRIRKTGRRKTIKQSQLGRKKT